MALHSGADLMLPRVVLSSLVTNVPPTAEKLHFGSNSVSRLLLTEFCGERATPLHMPVARTWDRAVCSAAHAGEPV